MNFKPFSVAISVQLCSNWQAFNWHSESHGPSATYICKWLQIEKKISLDQQQIFAFALWLWYDRITVETEVSRADSDYGIQQTLVLIGFCVMQLFVHNQAAVHSSLVDWDSILVIAYFIYHLIKSNQIKFIWSTKYERNKTDEKQEVNQMRTTNKN